jgi:hypothetical protein
MDSINDYINKLEGLGNNLEDIAVKEILKNKGRLVGKIKLRLYQHGMKGDGNYLPDYSYATVQYKASNRQVSTHMTLRDTGDWYKGMFMSNTGNKIFVSSRDEKHDELISIWGQSIVEFTESEQDEIIDSIVEPRIVKEINKLNKGIDLFKDL